MPFYLSLATAMVLLVPETGGMSVGGSCFAFRGRHLFLTANHCVPEAVPVVVLQQPGGLQRPAIRIDRNPAHDVALIHTEPHEEDAAMGAQVISEIAPNLVEGGDFFTYGFPVESNVDAPVGRTLKGSFQRYFAYTNNAGHQYFAAELSVPTPAGHSGGPVVRWGSGSLLEGVVTTNYESYILLDQVDEVDEYGHKLRIETRRVVSYGIAAMASALAPWLQDLGILDPS